MYGKIQSVSRRDRPTCTRMADLEKDMAILRVVVESEKEKKRRK